MKVSIITPAFNASATLTRCKEAITAQSYEDIEWIVVDDCSTDGCVDLVKDVAKVVMQPVNKGVAAARNAGLDVATGDYIYFVDADDWIEPDTIEKLVGKAQKENLDIVGCEWKLCFDKNERPMRQPEFNTPLEAMQAMMYGTMRWNLWLFLTKRELWDGVRFTEGQNMGEDMNAMFRLFLKANDVGLLTENLYHYSQPTLSKEMSESNIAQVTENMKVVESAIASSPYAENLLPLLPQLKLNIKLPLLISSKRDDYRKWAQWFSEADSHVLENHTLALHTRMLMWCASKSLWALVWIYYWLVYRLVNGLIYR